jgi:hypothetical protein
MPEISAGLPVDDDLTNGVGGKIDIRGEPWECGSLRGEA